MHTMGNFTTVWELVIRSGNVDLLRTTFGGVDRAFHKFTRKLNLLASYRPQFLIQDDSPTGVGFLFLLCQFCWSTADQGTASLFGAIFSGGCCALFVSARKMCTMIAAVTSWLFLSATESLNSLS